MFRRDRNEDHFTFQTSSFSLTKWNLLTSATSNRYMWPTDIRSIVVIAVLLILNPTAGSSQPALISKIQCPDRVKSVAFSPDGKLLVAGYGWNDEGGVKVWKLPDYSLVATLIKGDDNVKAVVFSSDGKHLAVLTWAGKVLSWNVGDWTKSKTLLTQIEDPEGIAFSKDSTKLLITSERRVTLYDLKTARSSTLLKAGENDEAFVSALFANDGKSIIAYGNGTLQIIDLESQSVVRTVKPVSRGFFAAIEQNSDRIVLGGGAIFGEKVVQTWDLKSSTRLHDITEFRSGVFTGTFSHSGNIFAVAGGDYGSGGDLSLWKTIDRSEIGYISFGEFPIQSLAFSPDDKVLAAGSDDGYVLLYSVERIRGPEIKKQDRSLCGEIRRISDRLVLTPISELPRPMQSQLGYPWMLEISRSPSPLGIGVTKLDEWYLESNSANDKVRIGSSTKLGPEMSITFEKNFIVIGDVQNPGWDEGLLIKLFADDRYVVTRNNGECVAFGSLTRLNLSYSRIRAEIFDAGFLGIPREPVTTSAAHYRTRFIVTATEGVIETRTDAEEFDPERKTNSPAGKHEAFSEIFSKLEPTINKLRGQH